MLDLEGDDRHILHRVLIRSAVDAAFRRRLIEDPRGAIEEATGVAIPDELRIRFIEPPPDVDALVVLPKMVGGTTAPDESA